jgi:4-hydroxy-2-oxoheptanedioate aldolase
MRENAVKRALARGEVVIGTMVSAFRSPEIAPMLAAAGFQFVLLDMEHSSLSIESVADIVLAAKATPLVPFVRVPGKDHYLLSRPLDAGAEGLLIPQVETRDQVEAIIQATKYFPLGRRGMALKHAHSAYTPGDPGSYIQRANKETFIIVQIESETAIRDLDQLVSVPGVDAALIGPGDLSQSLGVPGQTKHPKVTGCAQRFVEVCNRYGVAPGVHVMDRESAKLWLEAGVKLLAYANDISLIVDGGARAVREVRDLTGQLPWPKNPGGG